MAPNGGRLLERESQLARIDAALASACAGTGLVIVVEGEAGIGKTALLRAAGELASARAMAVLDARGSELEAGYAFGVVRQCLEPAAVGTTAQRDEGLFEGPASLAAPVVIDAPATASVESVGVFYGLYWLLWNLAQRQPLLIAIDDGHWADELSLRFLCYLVRRLSPLPAAVLVATRPIDGHGAQADVLAELLADPAAEALKLGALGELGVARLLREHASGALDDAFSRACHHATGGNPFLLTELVRVLREHEVPFTAAGAQQVSTIAPPQIARAVRARLARLGRDHDALARAVALLGANAPLDLACELAGLEPSVGARAADALLEVGLLDSGRQLRFRHPLLAAAVAANVTPSERDAWHSRAASLLRRRDASPEMIAAHLVASRAGLDRPDALLLCDVARHAVQRGAPDAAVPLLGRVLEEPLEADARIGVLLELGRAEHAAGLQAATEHLRDAVRLAGDPIKRADALLALKLTIDPNPEGCRSILPLLEAALDDLGAVDRERGLKLQAAWLSACAFAFVPIDRRQLEVAGQVARLGGDSPAECDALGQLLEHRFGTANAETLGPLAERAAKHPDEVLNSSGLAWPTVVAAVLTRTDRIQAAKRLVARWIDAAHNLGSAQAFAAANTCRSDLNRTCGRLREAENDASSAIAAAVPKDVTFALAHVAFASCLLGKGDIAGAQTARAAVPLVRARPFLAVLLLDVNLHAGRGEHEQAVAAWERACELAGDLRSCWQLDDWLLAIESQHSLGNHTAADRQLDQAFTDAQTWGTATVIGSVLRVRGRLASDHTAAIADLQLAIEHLERSPRRLVHAHALVDLGSALRRAGQRSDSRKPLRAGYELARECAADSLAETARQELAASGVRVRRQRLHGADSLTPSERRIALLAADNASNAQIAQTLFVTVKTVEMHLTHAYRKLDINRRDQLADALSDTAA